MSGRQCNPRDGTHRPSRQRCGVCLAGSRGPTLLLGEAFPVARPPWHRMPARRTLELCAYQAPPFAVCSALRCDLWRCVGVDRLCPRVAARGGLRDRYTDATERRFASRACPARHRCAYAVLHQRSMTRVSAGSAAGIRHVASTATPRESRPLAHTTAPATARVVVCSSREDASPWSYRAGGQQSGLR
jgi:hypothetical protein